MNRTRTPLPERRIVRLLAASLLMTTLIGRAGQLDSGAFKPVIDELHGQTLFAFDNLSIPFTRSLKVTMRAPEKFSQNPVVGRGQPGEADSYAIHFYGSVIRQDGRFRMWYVGTGDERGENVQHDSSLWRALYAESTDGVNWTKPRLGLVDYRGNKDNNILKLDPFIGTINVKVLHEPKDPDPARRYKMVTHVYWLKGGDKRHGTLAPYFSADGLTWKLAIDAQADGARRNARRQERPLPRALRARWRPLPMGRRLLFLRPESHSRQPPLRLAHCPGLSFL